MEQIYDAETTIVTGIICKKCNNALPPHTMAQHLRGEFNKCCPHTEEKHPNHEKISNLKGQLEDFKVDRQERNEHFIRRFLRLITLPDLTRFENPSCPIARMQELLNEWKGYRDDEAETEQFILRKLHDIE